MPIILLNTDSNSGVHNSSKYRTSIFLKPGCTYFIFIWWRKASTALHLLNESIHSFSVVITMSYLELPSTKALRMRERQTNKFQR